MPLYLPKEMITLLFHLYALLCGFEIITLKSLSVSLVSSWRPLNTLTAKAKSVNSPTRPRIFF